MRDNVRNITEWAIISFVIISKSFMCFLKEDLESYTTLAWHHVLTFLRLQRRLHMSYLLFGDIKSHYPVLGESGYLLTILLVILSDFNLIVLPLYMLYKNVMDGQRFYSLNCLETCILNVLNTVLVFWSLLATDNHRIQLFFWTITIEGEFLN